MVSRFQMAFITLLYPFSSLVFVFNLQIVTNFDSIIINLLPLSLSPTTEYSLALHLQEALRNIQLVCSVTTCAISTIVL